MSIYTEQGYESRKQYLECLADETGHSLSTVRMLAAMLGPNEDFDGLVTTLEDMDPEADGFDL